jgi:small subunit ribosomal protein S7
MSELKLFDRWATSQITITDPGLVNYINLDPLLVPRTGGRNSQNRFHKSKYNIVERLINRLMVPGHRGKKHKLSSGHITGKAITAYNIVIAAFEIIEKELGMNPVEVFVKAVENAAPREEITTIEYGGARYPQALEVAPQRRIDIALRQMTQGAYAKCFGKKVSIEKTLSTEIMKAYKLDQTSQAISKKLELERQAESSK